MGMTAFIFARGGSKGLPGKNIKLLCGKPLIAWSIEQAKDVECINRVIVSTDSLEIAEVARQYGAEVPFIRPIELARDDSSEWLAWRHALNHLKEVEGQFPEMLISVPATAPLRLPIDIENCINLYEKSQSDVVITVTDAHRSPYFNMVKSNPDGTVTLVNSPKFPFIRRQDVPAVFDVSTVCYVARSEFVLNFNGVFEGRVAAVKVPTERAIDIDTLLEFRFAEFLMAARGGSIL
jgi:N-acylneuraminate cytidylyltransferase